MRFFVYGTLKRGKHNNYLLSRTRYLGTAKTEPVYTLFDGGYPIIERGGTTAIYGEVFETEDEEIINQVFRLEGCSRIQHDPKSWYDFDILETPFGEANMFVMDTGKSGRGESKILTSGVWN